MNSIRNFCILAHIDHGKSTLADRFLELTGTVPREKMREQYLDMMELERERGITIKMQPVRMKYTVDSRFYILNLIDTPGHADFSYEVSRALAAVEGAILLVDATKGVQAQTIANFEMAQKEGLTVIPAVNKIDAPHANVKETAEELSSLLEVPLSQISLISAKYGTNTEKLLGAVVKEIPPPRPPRLPNNDDIFRALVFDSIYDPFRGIIAYVRVVNGEIDFGEKIYFMGAGVKTEAKELGYFSPERNPQKSLKQGEIGYIATGIKQAGFVRVGDTITKISNLQFSISQVTPLSGYKKPKPVVFASFYPESASDYDKLKDALSRLRLQDPAFTFEQESRDELGRGFRCGFLGSLHLEILAERLRREFQLSFIISIPSTQYIITTKNGKTISASSPSDWPDYGLIERVEEPWAKVEILTPSSHIGRVMELLEEFSASWKETKLIGGNKTLLVCEIPLRELIRDFYGRLKGVTHGYASLNYELGGWKEGDLIKLEILIAGEKEEAFSQITPREKAYEQGKRLVKALKDLIPQQQFAVALQAQAEGRIIARETIKAARKDVTAPLYGGDVTRKRKLLEKQKRGKKELKQRGYVRIPPKVFIEISRGRTF